MTAYKIVKVNTSAEPYNIISSTQATANNLDEATVIAEQQCINENIGTVFDNDSFDDTISKDTYSAVTELFLFKGLEITYIILAPENQWYDLSEYVSGWDDSTRQQWNSFIQSILQLKLEI